MITVDDVGDEPSVLEPLCESQKPSVHGSDISALPDACVRG